MKQMKKNDFISGFYTKMSRNMSPIELVESFMPKAKFSCLANDN